MSDAPIQPMEPLSVRLPAVQRLLGIGKTTVNKLCNAGHLDRVHHGRRAVVSLERLVAFV